MGEPAEFSLLSLVGAILIAMMFGVGFGLNYFLSLPAVIERFPIAEPLRGAMLSLMGVLLFALILGVVFSVLDLFIG